LYVLLTGSFREKKGFPDAIAALARLRDDVDLQVTIIGDEHGTPATRAEKRRILDELKRTGLDSCTRLTGYLPWSQALEESRSHHVFLSPSVTAADGDTEGGAPVSIIEMAASGMVIVSTSHCDIPHVIHDGESGLLAPEHDVDALVAHLRWLVDHPDKWIELQTAARRRVETEFDARVQGARLAAIYRDVASGGTT